MSSFSSARKQLSPSLLPLLPLMPLPLLPGQILTEQLRLVAFLPPSCLLFPLLSPFLPIRHLSVTALACHQSKILFTVIAVWYPPWILSSLSCHAALSSSSCTYICSLLFSPHPFSLIFPSLSPIFLFQESQPLWIFDPLCPGVLSVIFAALTSPWAPELPCRLFPRFITTAQLIYVMCGVSSLVSK